MNGQDPNQVNNNLNSDVYGATSLGGVNPTPVTDPNMVQGATNVNPTPMPQDPNVGVVNPSPVPNVGGVVSPTPVGVADPTGVVDPNAGVQTPGIDMSANNMGTVSPAQGVTQTPVAQPIPGTESLTGNTVASGGVNNPTGGNANAYVESRKPENIGVVPPPLSNDPKKDKKGFNKVLFVILILVLIAAIAFGLYYFLVMSNTTSTRNVSAQDVTVGVNETLTMDINFYATGDTDGCTPNISNVDTSVMGEYEYSITCDGVTSATGKVIVADTTAPVVELNTVFKSVGETVSVDEFVLSCTDPSDCNVEFSDETQVEEYLSEAGGPYDVLITASDTEENIAQYSATLYVTPYSVVAYTNCTSAEEELTDYSATKVINDILPIGRADGDNTLIFLGVAIREYTYTFESSEEYLSVIGDKTTTITFDDITGNATYDDNNYVLTITTDLSLDTLNTEAGGTFPTSYSEFIALYAAKGYTYSNKTTLD